MVETAVDDDEIMGDKIGAKSRDDESFRKPPSVNYRACLPSVGQTDGRTEAWRERNLRITLARILSLEQWPRDVAIVQSRG